jgi:LemA protein
MSNTVLVWVVTAVLVFWALGAYNRLVRLRSQGIVAFAVLANIFNQYVLFIKNCSRNEARVDPAPDWVGLDDAVALFASSLSLAQAEPLNEARMKTLKTSYESLVSYWTQLERLTPDLQNSVLPSGAQAHWMHISVQADIAQAEFKRAVENYNQAISQFPALLLVWIFGFKPAQSL